MSAQISSISSCCSSAADGEFFKDIPFVPISPSPLPFSISEKGSARSETPPPQGLSVNRPRLTSVIKVIKNSPRERYGDINDLVIEAPVPQRSSSEKTIVVAGKTLSLGALIAEGFYGAVYRAFDIDNKERPLAVKMSSNSCLDSGVYGGTCLSVLKEAVHLNSLTGIVPELYVHGLLTDGQYKGHYAIAMDRYDRSLLDEIKMRFRGVYRNYSSMLSFGQLMLKTAVCLRGMHAKGYLHGDLNEGNIVCRKNHDGCYEVRLIDLVAAHEGVALERILTTYEYMPPEGFILNGEGEKFLFTEQSTATDVWSFAVILAAQYFKFFLFYDSDVEYPFDEFLVRLVSSLGKPPEKFIYRDGKSREHVVYQDFEKEEAQFVLINKMLQEPLTSVFTELRPDSFDKDDRVKELYSCLEGLLLQMFVWDPEERITMEEVLEHPFFELIQNSLNSRPVTFNTP